MKMSKFILVVVTAIVLLAVTAPVNAAELKLEKVNGKERWVLENDRVRIEIDPKRGARVSQFKDKAFKQPLVRDQVWQGIFVDHLAEQNWPGELWEREYTARPISEKGNEVAIEFSITVKGSFRNSAQPKSRGVVIHKTYRLKDGEAGLRVEYKLENPTDKPKQFSLWVQTIQHLGDNPKENVAVRPATAGVSRFKMPEQPAGEAWSRYLDSIAAWQAVVDPHSGQGIVYFQDWNYLDAHYNAGPAYTVEWFMVPISLPPNQSWSTKAQMISRKMRPDLIGVTPEFWIGASLTEDEKSIQFTMGSEKPDLRATLSGELHAPREGRKFSISVKLKPGKNIFKLPQNCKPPVFLDATVTPEAGSAVRVAEFFGGEHFPKNEPLPGYPPLYQVKQPEKKPQFPRPERIELAPTCAKNILLVRGVMTNGMNVMDILEKGNYEVSTSYEVYTGKEILVSDFPGLHEQILKYGIVVFNNVDAKLLSPAQKQILADYVREAGGRVLVIAGTSMVKKNWADNPLHKLIAVEPYEGFAPLRTDLKATVGLGNELAELLPVNAYTVTWGTEKVEPVLKINGRILVGVLQVGKGKVLICGLTAMGIPVPEDYWQSADWQKLFNEMIKLLKEE